MVINPGDVWIIEEPTWPYSCDYDLARTNGNPLAVTDDQHAHRQFRGRGPRDRGLQR